MSHKMKAIKQENSSLSSQDPRVNMIPVPYFYPMTPMYNYGNVFQVSSLNSEFERMVQEISREYSAQGLSDSFGMLLSPTSHPSKMSPPATPTLSDSKSCGVCGKNFTSKQSLKSHMAIHADQVKPFDCSVCGSSFRRKHDLTRHHRSLHAQIKPFKCKFCDREYARSDALKRHLQSKAHSLPPELTNIVAAASRRAGFSDLM